MYLYTESGVGQDGEKVKRGYSVSACSQFRCQFFKSEKSKGHLKYSLPDGIASYTDGGKDLKPKCERTDCEHNSG